MKLMPLCAAIAAIAVAGCSSPAASSLSAGTAASSSSSSSSSSAAAAPAASHPATASALARAMGIKKFTAWTADTDPNKLLGRQREYTSKVNWKAGSIEVFTGHADAAARGQYLKSFTCPLGDGYDLLDGAALLRLSCDVTPTQAKAAEKKFRKAVGG
jgi:hypothetical protein